MLRITKLRFCACPPIPLTSCKVSTLIIPNYFQSETLSSLGCTWFLSIQDSLPEACQQPGIWMWRPAHSCRLSEGNWGAIQPSLQSGACLQGVEVTGTWPVNWNSITPDQTAPSIGLSSCGSATILPTSPVKAINTVLSQLPALLPSLGSPPDSTNLTPPTSDLHAAIEGLCKTLQDTHVSFLFNGSAASSANEVQPL